MKQTVSIVVPIFNEAGNIGCLYRELAAIFTTLTDSYDFELLFVDDGSTDASWSEIETLAGTDRRVRGVAFSRNFGHQYALEAGLMNARGDAVITIDADFEQPPNMIPALINHWEAGAKVVNARRNKYVGRSIFKELFSNWFYRLINKVSDVYIEPGVADFRLLDRQVVNEIINIREGERFYRGLVQWVGFNAVTIEYDGGKRTAGVSGYTIKKMLTLGWTAVTSFSTAPMTGIMFLGAVITLASTVLLSVMAYVKFILGSDYFSDIAFLVVFIILNNGVIMMILGIVAMYMLRIYKEVQHKPNFILDRKLNFDE